MIRSTTPTHELIFDDNILDDAEQIIVTYKQDRNTRSIFWAGGNTKVIAVNRLEQMITINWEQEHSRIFDPNRDVYVQVRVYTSDGAVAASNLVPTRVLQALDDRELGGIMGNTEGWEWIYDDLSEAEQRMLYKELGSAPGVNENWEWVYGLTKTEMTQLADYLRMHYAAEDDEPWDNAVTSTEFGSIARLIDIYEY